MDTAMHALHVASTMILLLVWAGVASAQTVKAFPSAEGFGATSVGGRGGTVIEVTNLADSGAGSFRACALATVPRTCVFRVGGVITLSSPIRVEAANSYLTIAGQTAPGEGITFTPYALQIFYGAHDVIVRHLRQRQGFGTVPADPNNMCGSMLIWGDDSTPVSNIIFDHTSVAWACDDAFWAFGHVQGATIQWSIMGEPYCSGVDGFGSCLGFTVGGNQPLASANTQVSYHHNMHVHGSSRNPSTAPLKTLDFRNNLIYNWSTCDAGFTMGGTDNLVASEKTTPVNLVGNRYIPGPNTDTASCRMAGLRTEALARMYVQDNVSPYCGGDACPVNEFNLGWVNATTYVYPAEESLFRVATPHAAPAVTLTPRANLQAVLSHATTGVGATVPQRDALDIRLIAEMNNGTGDYGRRGAAFPTLPTSTAAPTDTDHDGMPDTWETSHGLNPNSAADGAATATNGYTNLENYLNTLAGDAVPLMPDTPGAGGSVHVALPSSTVNPSAPAAQGLVGWWKALPGRTGGQRWYDLLGRYAATLTNMTTAGSGHAATTRPGGVGEVRLDGTDDYVQIPASTLLYPPAFTISMWFRRTGTGSDYQALIANSAGDSARTIFLRAGGGMYMSLLTTGSTCCYPDLGSTGPFSVGPWHHLGWVYSSTVGTHLWHNCTTELLSQAASGTTYQPINQTTLLGNTSPTGGDRFTGAYDDVRIYNRAMSQQEVCSVMRESSQGDPRLLPPSLLVLGAPSVVRTMGHFFPFFGP